MVFAWLSDKFEKRAFFIAIQAIITIVGLLMTGYLTLGAWRYAGTVWFLQRRAASIRLITY